MIEFLIALLLFTAVLAALLASQLGSKQLQRDAYQRTLAAAMAEDLLARVRGNSDAAANYRVEEAGAASRSPVSPDCRAVQCTPGQLARWDLWQWEQGLMGSAEQYAGELVGGLDTPRACVRVTGNTVSLAITWRGTTGMPPVNLSDCGRAALSHYDDPRGAPGNGLLRRQLLVQSFL